MKSIRDLITGRSVLSLLASATALDAARAMTTNSCGCVMVADKDGQPKGIFTERDLMTRVTVLGKDPNRVRLEEVMTRELYTVAPETRLGEARLEMRKRHIRHVPVVENGNLVAVLSLRDLLRADLEDHEKDLESILDEVQASGLPTLQLNWHYRSSCSI